MSSTWKKVVLVGAGLLSLVVALVVGALALVLSSKPALPTLSAAQRALLKSRPVKQSLSPSLQTFLQKSPKDLSDRVLAWKEVRDSSSGWFADVAKAEKHRVAMEPVVRMFRWVVTRGGCPPVYDPKTGELPNMYRFLQASRMIWLGARLQIQKGAPGQGARELLWLLRHIHRQIVSCRFTLVSLVVWLAVFERTLEPLRLALAHPLFPASERRATLVQLKRLDGAWSNPLPDMIRTEYAFALLMLHQLDTGEGMFGKMQRSALMMWPWWDRENSKGVFQLLHIANIRRASLPVGPAFWKSQPEERVLERVRKEVRRRLKRWPLLQYNAIGLKHLVNMPDLKKYLLRWHRAQCVLAATRAWGAQVAKARGQELPPALTRVLHPFTRKPFGKVGNKVCAIRNPVSGSVALKPVSFAFQPWTPALAKASSPPPPPRSRKGSSRTNPQTRARTPSLRPSRVRR